MRIPQPVRLGGSTRWSLSDLEQAEAAAKGDPQPNFRNSENEIYFSAKQVAARYNVSLPTVWRWSREVSE